MVCCFMIFFIQNFMDISEAVTCLHMSSNIFFLEFEGWFGYDYFLFMGENKCNALYSPL